MDITMMQWIDLTCTLKRIADALEYMAGPEFVPDPELKGETNDDD